MNSFTSAKSKVRELNLTLLRNRIPPPWKYFGLPSTSMEDVELLKDSLSCVHAVERGIEGREWKVQHNLAVTAILKGYRGFKLFRGDIDEIILESHDQGKQMLDWPYDLVNLDYTGGIIYKNSPLNRVKSIQKVVEEQGNRETSFVLLITVNDKHYDEGEISKVIKELGKECGALVSPETLGEIDRREDRRFAIFIYTTYVVITTGRRWFRVEPLKPIFYFGTGEYKMLNMSFYLEALQNRDAPAQGTKILCKAMAYEPIEVEKL